MKKIILYLYKIIIKLLKRFGFSLQEVLIEVMKIMIDEVTNLNEMTIAELRNLAKANGISLEGKRVKSEIIEVLEKHLTKEE